MSAIYNSDVYVLKSSVHFPIDPSKFELLRLLKNSKASNAGLVINFKSYDGDVVDNVVDDEEEASENKYVNECHNYVDDDDDEEGYKNYTETCPFVSLLLVSTTGDELKTLKLMLNNVTFMVALNMGTNPSEAAVRVELQASKLKTLLDYYLKITSPSSQWDGQVSYENTGIVVSVAKNMPLNTLLMYPDSSIHSGVKSAIYKFTVSPVTCVKMYKKILDFLRDNSSVVKNALSPTTLTPSFEWCLLVLFGNHRHLNGDSVGGAGDDWLNSDFIIDSLILEGSVSSKNLKEYKEFCGTRKHGIVYQRRCSGASQITSERLNKTDFIVKCFDRHWAGDRYVSITRQPEFICTFAKLSAIRIGGKLQCLAITFTTVSGSETIAVHLPSLDKVLIENKISIKDWTFVKLNITPEVEHDVKDVRRRIEAKMLMPNAARRNIDDDDAIISQPYEMFLIDNFVDFVSVVCNKRHLGTNVCIHDGRDERLITITDTFTSSSKEGVLLLSSPVGIVSQMIKRALISANSINRIERVFDRNDNSLMFSGKRFNPCLRFLKKEDVRRFEGFSPATTALPRRPLPGLESRKEIEMNVEKEFVTCALEHGIYFPIDRFTFQNSGIFFFENCMENDVTVTAPKASESHSAIYARSIATRAAPLRDNVFQYLSDSLLTNNFKYMNRFTPYIYDNNHDTNKDRRTIEVDCCFNDSPPRFIPWTIARILQMSFENVCIVESKYLLHEFGETTGRKFPSLSSLIDNHWLFKYDVDFLENCYKHKEDIDGGGRNQNLLRTLLVTSIEDLRLTSRVIVIFIYFDSEGNFSDDDLSVKCYLNAHSHKGNDLFSYIRRVAQCGEGETRPAINSQYFVYNTAVSYLVDAYLQSISNRLTNMSICHTFWQNHAFYVQRSHLESSVISVAKNIVEEMDDRKKKEYKGGQQYRDSKKSSTPSQLPWRSFLYKSDEILSSIKREPKLTGTLVASNKKGYVVAYEGNRATTSGGSSSRNAAVQLKYVFFSPTGTIHDYREFWANKQIMGGRNDDVDNGVLCEYNIWTTGKIILDSIVVDCHLFKCEDDYGLLLERVLSELTPSHFSIQASLNAEEYAAFKVDSVKCQQMTTATTTNSGGFQNNGGRSSNDRDSGEDTRFAIQQRNVIGACYQDPELRYVAGDTLSLIPVIKTGTTHVIPIVSTNFDPEDYRVEYIFAFDHFLKFSRALSDILTTFFPERASFISQKTAVTNNARRKEDLLLSTTLHDMYVKLKSRLLTRTVNIR